MKRWCDWAGCRNPATAEEGGWWHCRPHLYEHRRQQTDEEYQQLGRSRGGRLPTVPCGTRSAAARHWRNSEPLCDPCREAVRAYDRTRKRRSA